MALNSNYKHTAKTLTLLTKNFGRNFTGATLATHEYIVRIENEFDEVNVLCLNKGSHELKRANVTVCKNVFELYHRIRSSSPTSCYYSDDHLGFIFKLAKRPYIHSYHGNWPDAMFVAPKMFIKGLFFLPLYFLTLKFSRKVTHVSYYMENKTRWINAHTLILRNGLREVQPKQEHTSASPPGKTRILMLGNIDDRKYGKLPALCKKIDNSNLKETISIDIFGNIHDARLAKKVEAFSFANIKGFRSCIPFKQYQLFLSLSMSENLPISTCEALEAEIPVLSFNIGGLNEVIVDGENGFLVPAGNLSQLIKKLTLITENGYNFEPSNQFLKSFSWDISARRLLKVLIRYSDET